MYEWQLNTTNTIVFVMVDSNGDEVTGLGTGFTLQLSKNGAAFAASTGTKAEIANGWYSYIATASESDTEGVTAIKVTGAGAAQQNLVAHVSDIQSDVWEHTPRTLTQSGASVASTVSGTDVTIVRGDTLSASFTGLGVLTGYVTIDFSVKTKKSIADSAATIKIRKNISGSDDGLLYINGTVAGTSANGSITIDNATDGDITVTLAASESYNLSAANNLYYDIQLITATSVTTLSSGSADIVEDVSREVS